MGLLHFWHNRFSKSELPNSSCASSSCSERSKKSVSLNWNPPSNYWGSKEEFEVGLILQEIVSSCLDENYCEELVKILKDKLFSSSTGWIDKFVSNQGILVLHKLLDDVHTYKTLRIDRELDLMQCMHTVFDRGVVAQQLLAHPSPEKILKTILKSVISPCEETRLLASETVLKLKMRASSQSRVLQSLTLSR